MNIFDNVKDLEKMYENLLNEAKERHTKEFRKLREKSDKIIEERVKILDEFINKVLENLTIELQKKTNEYKKTIAQLFQKIEQEYKENKEEFINQIIKILELPF
ncbi:MAG: hypothetical protein ACFFBH_08720 [Promethearchaeota archaeon]